jgi:energy-dependent translational throttle protein EttA
MISPFTACHRDFDGKLWHNPGIRLGYLAQEPHLDPTKDVAGNIMDGLREKTSLLGRMDELSAELGNPDADMDKVV